MKTVKKTTNNNVKNQELVDINHLSKLANLELNPAQKKSLLSDLTSILDYVDEVKSIKLEKTIPTAQVIQSVNHFRTDLIIPSLTQRQALQSAKNTYNGYFVVDRIIHNE